MLKIIFQDEIDTAQLNSMLIADVEVAFDAIQIKGTQTERELLRIIEQAQYNDSTSFIDRFGAKLYFSELSSGCKAALCVCNYADKIISLLECGLNARDAIINVCSKGAILIADNSITIQELSSTICVELDGYAFSTVSELNRYINDIRPFPYTQKLE